MFIENEFYHEYLSITRNSPYKSKFSTEDKDYVYLESHHIIPKSMGGDDSSENLVLLTAQDHYRCHELLPFFTEGEDRVKMIIAWNLMSKRNGIIVSSSLYSELQEERAKIQRRIRGCYHPSFGKLHSKETKLLLSKKKLKERSPRFKGYYHTPFGKLTGRKEIDALSHIISRESIRRWCKNPDKIITRCGNSLYLRSLKTSPIGKTYKQLGFWFEEA